MNAVGESSRTLAVYEGAYRVPMITAHVSIGNQTIEQCEIVWSDKLHHVDSRVCACVPSLPGTRMHYEKKASSMMLWATFG